jgi:hypothetical protein
VSTCSVENWISRWSFVFAIFRKKNFFFAFLAVSLHEELKNTTQSALKISKNLEKRCHGTYLAFFSSSFFKPLAICYRYLAAIC